MTLQRFERDFFSASSPFTFIGDGELGGKGSGLARSQELVALPFPECEAISVAIPYLVALTTEGFDAFMATNDLYETALSGMPDERIAHAFLKAELPYQFVGDVRAMAEQVRTPLAVRSSSLLEDSLDQPFAGVYATKMTPNNQLDVDSRFRKLVEAVKLVYASTFFHDARAYRASVGASDEAEKMAVLIQAVAGRRFGERFYPHVSGVARSYNYYPSGNAKPEEGYCQLALGLGKTIVDGDPSWGYSPAYPKAAPPFNNLGELLKVTQTGFWAVNMGAAPYNPEAETEYMIRGELPDAEQDGTLASLASTFDVQANRLVPGVYAKGPRLLNFAPMLQYNQVRLNDLVRALLARCEAAYGSAVEVEFALTLDPEGQTRPNFSLLQVRAMRGNEPWVEMHPEDLEGQHVLVASDQVLGNGALDDLQDVVYVRPEAFDTQLTRAIVKEVDAINARLVAERRPYVLVGFGRWGTSDPTCGIPVTFGQISGAKVIVETQLPTLRQDLSQGSHFFHNLTSLRVLYFSVPERTDHPVDFAWLDRMPAVTETAFVRHVRLPWPLRVRVDGRTGKGVVLRHE